MATKLLAVLAVCCQCAVFVSAKSTSTNFRSDWGVGAGLFQVATIVTDENNVRLCEYKVREERDKMAEQLAWIAEMNRLVVLGLLKPDGSDWPEWHPAPATYTRLRLPVGSTTSTKKVMGKHCVFCFNCSENGMSCTQDDVKTCQ